MKWKWRQWSSTLKCLRMYWTAKHGQWRLSVVWLDGYWVAETYFRWVNEFKSVTRHRSVETAKRRAEKAVPKILLEARLAILNEIQALGVEVPDDD